MAINLTALANGANKALGLANLILVTPNQTTGYQPQNAPSFANNTALPPPSILFNYEGENTANLTSDITDHFIEDNTAVQDQISLKPITITTQGFVGELNDVAPAALEPLKIIAEKLTTVSGYVPALSTTALLAYANAFQLYQVGKATINSAVGAWASINGSRGANVINGSGFGGRTFPAQTQQQLYFQQFYAYWFQRTLFTIQTPWAIFQDMAIMNVRAVQDAETRMISDFEVQFKQLRFASTAVVDAELFSSNQMSGRASNQGAKAVNNGTQTLQPSTETLGSKLVG